MSRTEPTDSKFDQFLQTFAPNWALKRKIAQHNLGVVARVTDTYGNSMPGYGGGVDGRTRPWIRRGTEGEDNASGWTYQDMISNAMQLYRNDPMTKSIVNVSASYLGESRPTAATSNPEWNNRATDWFNTVWWPQADARGRNGCDFGEIQTLFDKWCWIGGDMLYLLFDGQLLPYEGTQIQTPHEFRNDSQIVNGIRMGAAPPWRISHYYLADGKQTIGVKQKYKRVRQSGAIFAGSRNWRTAMLRSVPDLHGVIDALHSFNRTNDNVQRKIEFESMMFSLEKKGAVGSLPGTNFATLNSTTGEKVEKTKADWGMRLKINGDVDKDFKFATMQNPNANYVETMEFMARAIASGTGFPLEIVMHIYTSGSYTANRAARLDFQNAIMDRWAWRNKVLNQRVWNWRVAKAIKSGELPPAPVDEKTGLSQWHKCTWTMPHFRHIDEGKEVAADIKQWGCGQESVADWAQNRGMTRTQLLDAHDADIAAFKERADALGVPLEQYMGQLFTASAAPQETQNEKN